MGKRIDLTSKKFGRWTVISQAKSNPEKHAMWNCKCECGNTGIIKGYTLRHGESTSCGCYRKEIQRARGLK